LLRIRDGKKVIVTETTYRNPDGTIRKEVQEKTEDESGNVKEKRYVVTPEGNNL